MIFELRRRTNYHSIKYHPELEELFRTGDSLRNRWQRVIVAFAQNLSRRKVGDFPYWSGIPVFSERAAVALNHLLKPNGELLPIECDGIALWAFNITRMADILDESGSELGRFSDGRVMHIKRYRFDATKIGPDLTIFKLPQQRFRVYVTDVFANAVESAGLEGFAFDQLWPLEPKVRYGKPPPHSLNELMERDARGELDDDFDDQLWGLLCDHITTVESLDAWPEPVRAYYASRLLEFEVGNGGFAQAAMNIPEWFEEAAKGYEVLGKPSCAALIRSAMVRAQSEAAAISKSSVSIEKAFSYFDEGHFEEFDCQLDEAGWWSDEDRVDFVRANRRFFSEVTKRA